MTLNYLRDVNCDNINKLNVPTLSCYYKAFFSILSQWLSQCRLSTACWWKIMSAIVFTSKVKWFGIDMSVLFTSVCVCTNVVGNETYSSYVKNANYLFKLRLRTKG